MLIALIGLVLFLGYPVYDAYCDRNLPSDEVSLIKLTGEINRVDDNLYLTTNLFNASQWTISGVNVTLLAKATDTPARKFEGAVEYGGSPHLIIDRFQSFNGAVKLSKEATDFVAQHKGMQWSYEIQSAQGHRRPIRLLKAPLDFIVSLFERV